MPQIIEYYRPRIIIGKGGMGAPIVIAMKKFGCVYLAFPGGAAVVGANCIKKVHAVHWLELGMPEALWVIEVNKFGPLIVTIDTNGNSLHETVDRTVHHNYSCLLNK
jgi:tartrate/fumarate subfamily iron-sulfur-dependent hydro-lyase beta chain